MKRVLLIGGGVQEIPAVEIAQSLGYSVLVTDKNDNAPCFQYADGHATIDGKDLERLVAYAWENNIDGVFTMTELVTSVAVVADALRLPGCSIKAAVNCQHKGMADKILRNTDIPIPRGGPAAGLVELDMTRRDLGGVAFIKPVVGAGAKGARKVSSVREIADCHGEVMVQEYLEGTHHDAGGLFDGMRGFHSLGITDREFENLKEAKVSAPTSLTNDQQDKLYQHLCEGAWALGIRDGPIKCDAMLTDDGFKILEYAPRLHGPKSTLFVLPAVGIDPLLPTLQCLTNQSVDTIDLVVERSAIMERQGSEWLLKSIGHNMGDSRTKVIYNFGE